LISRILSVLITVIFLYGASTSFAGETYKSKGTVNAVNVKGGKVSLKMDALPSLKWPPMTMDFDLAETRVLERLKPGQKVEFDFVEKSMGRYEIKKIIWKE
jgi:Cu/Ag efflux protein CusF